MPLQSSGIIVVEKTSVIAGSGTTTTLTNNKSNLQQFYEFYDVNDGNVGNIITETNNNNSSNNGNNSNSNTNNNPLMRRHQRTISSSSSSSIHSPSQQQQQQIKHHQVVTTNLQTLAYNQQQQQQQQMNQQQHHLQQSSSSSSSSSGGGAQQLIVSEEYIEHAAQNAGAPNNATGSGGSNGGNGNVMISTTNDVLNQQIIKIVTAGGPTGNMIIDSMGNLTTTNGNGGGTVSVGGNNGTSKVLFNNLTVMSKQANSAGTGGVQSTGAGQLTQQQHHQQTINFVNAKSLPYITTTSKGQTTTLQKMTAYKTNNISIKQGVGNQSSQQQHHVLTSAGRQTVIGSQQQQGQSQQQVVQKVTMPRNVQMVTRVQTLVAPQHSPAQQQQQQQQQHLSNSGQMVMQQKYVHNIVTTGNTGIGGGKTNLIKKSTGQSMKLQQHKIINTQQQQGVKTFIQQQSSGGGSNQQHYQTININQSQHQNSSTGVTQQTTLKHIKSQKIIKQYNNAITNSSGAVSVATLHHNHSVNASSVPTSGTYTISNKINTSVGMHQQHHLSTKLSKHPKYVMQNHIVIPSAQNQNHKVVNNSGGNSIMVNQQILNTINSCNSNSGTIKFVNAHGTVIQQQQQQQQQQQAPTIITTTTQKVRTNSGSSGGGSTSSTSANNHQYQQPQQVHITQQQFVTTDGTKTDGNNIYHIASTPTGNYIQNSAPSQQNAQSSPLHSDDIMIVNGTQMTDELSARILQSMAQKSFNNQQRFHQQQQQQQQQQQTQQQTSTKIIHQSSNMPPPAQLSVQQQQQQQQQHHASTSNLILSPKEYPIYGVQQQQYQHTQHQRLCNSAPNSRSQSLERKYHDTTISTKKSATDYYKVKNDNIVNQQQQQQQHHVHLQQSQTASMASRIPIGTTLTQHQSHQHQPHQQQQQQQHQQQLQHQPSQHQQQHYQQQLQPQPQQQQQQQQQHYQHSSKRPSPSNADQDDELIGEEVRPIPVNTNDVRLQVLQAVLQDHTYVVPMPTRFPIEIPSPVPVVASSPVVLQHQHQQHPQQHQQQTQQHQPVSASSSVVAVSSAQVVGHSKIMPPEATKVVFSTSLSTNNIAASGQVSQLSMNNVSVQNQHGPTNTTTYTMYGQQIARPQQDEDAHSAISNGSTRVTGASGDIDPGEETETAPEAEAEDDSVTRCICDLTHDDGYMICCDKCSAWQHVDCMGIDRQNIPDEYLCELCQPRDVDRARARSLQLQKRKEQTQMLLNASQMNSVGITLIPNDPSKAAASTAVLQQQQQQTQPGLNSALPGSAAPQQLTKKGKLVKRKELVKKAKKEKTTGLTAAAKRRETKKTTKRKAKNTGDPVDKHAANLRQWIENYELAVTNHYSPELRARLHAISKQPNLLHTITATENKALKNCGNLENKATTVPHAGGKILISNFDIPPNSPIFELRGKYMLTTQYKNSNTTVNMNSPPPSNYLQTLKSHKIPGAFIFFYQLASGGHDGMPNGPEICVDTRTYGNEARFVRRSCRPNAVIQHLFEKGTIHLYIVSLTNIMASTEITIKHEPHDLLALENKKQYNFAIQPTSTSCACGLTKDCLFGVPTPMPPAATPTTKPMRSNSKVVLNGCMGEKGSTAAGSSAASKKKAQNMNRGRSTSSSGDSNAGLLSPNANISHGNNNNNSYAPNLYNSTASIASLMHDSGVYTSSSSPSVSIPSPPTTHISSPPVQPPINLGHVQSVQQLVAQPVQHVTHLKFTPPTLQQPMPPVQSLQQLQQPPIVLNNLPAPLLLPPPLAPQLNTGEEIVTALSPAIPIVVQPPMDSKPESINQESKPLNMLPSPVVVAAKPIQFVPQEVKMEVVMPLATPLPCIIPPTEAQSQPSPQLQMLPQPVAVPVVEASASIVPVHTVPEAVVSQKPEQLVPVPDPVMAITQEAPIFVAQQQAVAQQQVIPEPLQPTPSVSMNEVNSPVKSPQKATTCGRKTPAKQPRTSMSEDSNGASPQQQQLQHQQQQQQPQEHHQPQQQQQQQQQAPNTPTPPKKTEEKRESRKLTREERKMEAILRAFEKMEKNQQRKQELKQAKTDVSKRRNSNSPSPKRSNSADCGAPFSSGHNSVKKNVSNSMRKKKRKSHKSYNINSHSQRKRRKSRMNSNDSDGAGTSEESSSMLSPPIQGLQNCVPPGGIPTPESVANRQSQLMSQLMEGGEDREQEHQSLSDAANVDAAAGLLLAFANPEKDINIPAVQDVAVVAQMEQDMKSPERQDVSGDSQTISPPVTPTIVSSTCLLIEAAVGPLENLPESAGTSGEFKYPAKTKTKKVLMSNWLNQSSDFIPNPEAGSMEGHPVELQPSEMQIQPQQYQHQEIQHQELQLQQHPITPQIQSVGLDSLVQAAMCDYGQVASTAAVASPSYMTNAHVSSCEEPQNLSMVAMKVEEFIHQTEATTTPHLVAPPPPPTPSTSMENQRNALTLPLQVSTCSNNSSVKKRWLRQAISEETDESCTPTPLSGISPQLPNGFTTPLKKRRLVINSDGAATSEDFTPEDLSRSYTEHGAGEPLSMVKQEDATSEFKEEMKQEADIDDDVDILRSPSPGQKMVAEDNLVKIEPEDISSGDDVKIDVEREESREGGGEKFEFKAETKQEESEALDSVGCKMEVKDETVVKIEKNEAEEQEQVEVEDHVKSEDEYIAVVDEPAVSIAVSAPVVVSTPVVVSSPVIVSAPVEPSTAVASTCVPQIVPVASVCNQQVKSTEVKEEIKPKVKEPVEKPSKVETPQPAVPSAPQRVGIDNNPHAVAPTKKSEEKKSCKKLDDKPPKQRKSSSSSSSSAPKTIPAAGTHVVPKLDSSAENENIPDELADIQERLHSFHKENIMILQSRNKKTKSPKHSSTSSTTTTSTPSAKVSHSSSTKKTSSSSKKSKKARKNAKNEVAETVEKTPASSSKSKSTKKSSSSSSKPDDSKEKGKKRHRTSSTSSTISSSKKRQLNFEHIDRIESGKGHHKRTTSTSSSKDDCSAPKKRRESSRSDESHKSSSKSSKAANNSMALLPFKEQAISVLVSTPQQPMSVPPHSALPLPTAATFGTVLHQATPPAPSTPTSHIAAKEDNFHHVAMTIPCFNHTAVSGGMPIAGYVVASSPTTPLPPATQGYDMQTLMKVPPSAVSVTTPGGHQLPYYSTIYGKLIDGPAPTPTVEALPLAAVTSAAAPAPTMSTNLLLGDYLDTKTKSFSSLGSFSSHSTLFGSGLNSVKVAPSSIELASASTTAITSPTSNDPTTPVADGTCSTRLQTTPLKMLTKTASHDPRLNPSLTAPEPPPAPKRKLSINEYRKRKQQSTDSNIGSPEGTSGVDSLSLPTSASTPTPTLKSAGLSQGASTGSTTGTSASSSTSENVFDKAFDDCERRNSHCNNKIDDTPKVQFSPAPTLLEKQQESMSERLKSLKSKQASSAASMGISSLLDSATSTLIGSATNHLSLHRDNFISSTLNRTNSDLDNCLESISSSSTSLASSRETTPEPRDHQSQHATLNKTEPTKTTAEVASSLSNSIASTTNTIATTKTKPLTNTTKATENLKSAENCLSYSPILDTSADNFDSPIAEAIEHQKAAATSSPKSKQPDNSAKTDTTTEKDDSSSAHGKKE